MALFIREHKYFVCFGETKGGVQLGIGFFIFAREEYKEVASSGNAYAARNLPFIYLAEVVGQVHA